MVLVPIVLVSGKFLPLCIYELSELTFFIDGI